MWNEQRGTKVRPKLETDTNGKRHIAGRYCPFPRNGQGFCEQYRKWQDKPDTCDNYKVGESDRSFCWRVNEINLCI